jgi:hypothetical protein
MDFESSPQGSPVADERETPRGGLMDLRTVRRSKDGLLQSVEVYCAPEPHSNEIRVTGFGSVLKNTDVTDLQELVGKTFASREELDLILNGGRRY